MTDVLIGDPNRFHPDKSLTAGQVKGFGLPEAGNCNFCGRPYSDTDYHPGYSSNPIPDDAVTYGGDVVTYDGDIVTYTIPAGAVTYDGDVLTYDGDIVTYGA